MRALAATTPGGALSFVTVPRPQCVGPRDVLVRVSYSELNPVDYHKAEVPNSYKQLSQSSEVKYYVPGFGGSGTVVDAGEGCVDSSTRLAPATPVVFMCDPNRSSGSYAEYVVVNDSCVATIPDGLSLREAATASLAALTAYESLSKLGLVGEHNKDEASRNKDPRRLLIVAGAGGVGIWAIILARALYGQDCDLEIVVTASTKDSSDWCTRLGATRTIPHDYINSNLSGGREGSVDSILCLAEPTPSLFGWLADVIHPYGSICLVVGGDAVKSLDLGLCFFKCANVLTETVFSSIRTNFKIIQPAKELAVILAMLAEGKIRAPLSPLLRGGEAFDDWKDAPKPGGILEALASGHARGKLVMRIATEPYE